MYVTKSFAVTALSPQVIYSNITFMYTDFSSKLCFVMSRFDFYEQKTHPSNYMDSVTG
jgi:hypothetical protein